MADLVRITKGSLYMDTSVGVLLTGNLNHYSTKFYKVTVRYDFFIGTHTESLYCKRITPNSPNCYFLVLKSLLFPAGNLLELTHSHRKSQETKHPALPIKKPLS